MTRGTTSQAAGHGGTSHSIVGRCNRTIGAALLAVVVAASAGCTASTPRPEPSALAADITQALEASDVFDMVLAVLVHQHGEPVVEQYVNGGSADLYLDLRSITKSVTSTLIGIAIDRGEIPGVDATLGELLPSYADSLTSETAAIPLHDVLTQTAGFGVALEGDVPYPYWNEPDWIRAILVQRAERGPGNGAFEYTDASAHLLSAILTEATGESALTYAREHLFGPLGIVSEPAWTGAIPAETNPAFATAIAEYRAAGFAWPTDPQGIQNGGSQLKLTSPDLLAFGRLHLLEGLWEGQHVVSSQWVADATREQVWTSGNSADIEYVTGGYGYQWWVDEINGQDVFLGLGLGGNLVAVVPDAELEVVVMSAWDDWDPRFAQTHFSVDRALNLVRYIILPAFG